ncbi:MAG: hypothetical protein ABFC28_03890 [Rikenellaceae bacterium]
MENTLCNRGNLDRTEYANDLTTSELKKSKAKGWYNPKTDEVVIVSPNKLSLIKD